MGSVRQVTEYEQEQADKKARGEIYQPIIPGSYHGPVWYREYENGVIEVDFDLEEG